MKPVIIATGAVAAMVGMLYIADISQSVTYEAPEAPETVEVEVEVDNVAKAVKDALESNSEALKAKAQAAYDQTMEIESKKIELEVRQKLQAEHDAMIDELEKEVGVY